MRSDIAPGGTFPDYELPDQERVPRKLSDLEGDDPLILTLARGQYCPKKHQQHLQLAAFYPQIAVAYTKIVTIASATHHETQELRASVGASTSHAKAAAPSAQLDNARVGASLVLRPRATVSRDCWSSSRGRARSATEPVSWLGAWVAIAHLADDERRFVL
jgi:AhpC/TSA family